MTCSSELKSPQSQKPELATFCLMALAQAIKFRNLVAELSHAETRSSFTELALSDPELIIRSLSFRFIHQSTRSNECVANAKCNDILSTIIQSRDSEDNESSDDRLETVHCQDALLEFARPSWTRDLMLRCRRPTDRRI